MEPPSLELPSCETLHLRRRGATLFVTLNRPEVKNAMNLAMARELTALLDALEDAPGAVRTLVLRGTQGTFCAGGDVKEMAAARREVPAEGQPDPLAQMNRLFGAMITRVDRAPQAVVAVLEGAVLGGGFGLACVADVAIARYDASFGLPETGLGLVPAQIATFLVQRLGRSQARRLAVTGGRFDGHTAFELGLVHVVCHDRDVEPTLQRVLDRIDRCAPGAIAVTKELINKVGIEDHEALLDLCARRFAEAARGDEGVEGMQAFLDKRPPRWRELGDDR